MPKRNQSLNALAAAIVIQHECEPRHRGSVFVEAKTEDNEIVWRGDVQVFDLIGHQKAKTCYAWQHDDGSGDVRTFAILRTQLIDSPKRAVQAAIFVDAQPPLHTFAKEMEQLKEQIDQCQNSLRKIGIKAEDLTASIHAAREIQDTIMQKRNASN